jgi:hypothetical protein
MNHTGSNGGFSLLSRYPEGDREMLNEVVIEGYVSGRPWTYSGDQFFRLGSYRDRQRPAKKVENRDEPDYVTARLTSHGLPVLLQGGMKVRAHGYLQSRYFAESLGEWLKDAKGPTNALSVSDELRAELKHNRVITEFVVEKLVVLEMPNVKAARDGKKVAPASELATE